MNSRKKNELQFAANALSRAEQENKAEALTEAYIAVKEIVESILQKSPDVPTVLQVEYILNEGNANVRGNSTAAYNRMGKLSEKAGFALRQYAYMHKNLKCYVAANDMSHLGLGIVPGERAAPETVPYDSVRSAFTQFRKELLAELANRKIDKYPDNRETNTARFNATIVAERGYLEEYLSARDSQEEEAGQKHVDAFDRRMAVLALRIEPRF